MFRHSSMSASPRENKRQKNKKSQTARKPQKRKQATKESHKLEKPQKKQNNAQPPKYEKTKNTLAPFLNPTTIPSSKAS